MPAPLVRSNRQPILTSWLYFRAVAWEFRFSFLFAAAFIAIGAILFAMIPQESLQSRCPDFFTSIYAAWLAMLGQTVFVPPQPWYLELLQMIYPIAGFIIIGEGVVRFALLMISKRQGEKEWMRVMASTARNHVILCGLGHLGFRVLEHLTERGIETVALEKDPDSRFLTPVKALGIPVLIRDMKEDQALLDAGIEHAMSIIIATNDDMANIEVALDARRLNAGIRVIMRLFEQDIARKITGALTIDAAFSSSTLAAPMVAAMSLGTKVMTNVMIAGTQYVIAEVPVKKGSAIEGRRIDQIELGYTCRVLAILQPGGAKQSPPAPSDIIAADQTIVVHVDAEHLAGVSGSASA